MPNKSLCVVWGGTIPSSSQHDVDVGIKEKDDEVSEWTAFSLIISRLTEGSKFNVSLILLSNQIVI